MTDLTFVELFAGVGGMSMGLEMAGWRCVGHAEWEAFPRRVLKHRWPDVPLWGDVSQLNGRDIVRQVGPFQMLTFGAPCQDFSIAGKREGMDGERSVLVLDALRIWEESGAPFALYENVVGMLSSNQGADFAGILSAFVGATVPLSPDGWRGAGVATGPAGIAAWRTLDAQYFGVPQRRRRVFVLGVRGRDLDPAEVLSLAESLSGHFAPSQETRENLAADVRTSPAATGAYPVDTRNATRTTEKDEQNRQGCGIGNDGDPSPTLTGLFTPAVIPILEATARQGKSTEGSAGIGQEGDPMFTLTGKQHGVMTYEWHNQDSRIKPVDVAATLSLNAEGREGHLVLHHEATVLRNREGKPGGGKGPLLSEGKSLTLGTQNDQVLFAPTLASGEHVTATITADYGNKMGLNDQHIYSQRGGLYPLNQVGIPRRLTPVECERLMGWPDSWTDVPDEKGRPAADTARYKACGNGVASPVAAWIGFRLRDALTNRLPDESVLPHA
jgi:DNA (cytosine-5)-methyltransferase 1